MDNLKICYGSEFVTLNKGEQHMVLTKEDLAFIVESALRNMSMGIKVIAK